MSKQGFIAHWQAGFPEQDADDFVVIPCDCPEGDCKGWGMVAKNPAIVRQFYKHHYPTSLQTPEKKRLLSAVKAGVTFHADAKQNAPSSTSSMRHPASAWKAMNEEFWLRAEGELYGECLQELPDMVQAFQRLYVHLYERMLADLRLPESWETNLYRLEKQLCGGQHAYHEVNPRYKDRLAERANARDKEQTASRSTCVALIATITERHGTMEVGQVWTMDASVYLVSRMLGGMDALLHLAVPGTNTFHTDGTWLSQLLPEADLISFTGIDRAALERSGIG